MGKLRYGKDLMSLSPGPNCTMETGSKPRQSGSRVCFSNLRSIAWAGHAQCPAHGVVTFMRGKQKPLSLAAQPYCRMTAQFSAGLFTIMATSHSNPLFMISNGPEATVRIESEVLSESGSAGDYIWRPE